jgi:hypothetical protein
MQPVPDLAMGQDCQVDAPTMSLRLPEVQDSDEPATLYRVMQATIAQGLEESYQVPKEIPHQLLVLLMQINQRKRRK